MNIYNRIKESLQKSGFKRTVNISLVSLLDYYFDFKYGTDTVNQIELHELEINSDNWKRGERYGLTPSKAFMKFMSTLHVSPDSVFVDLGCGKGKNLLLASQFNFKRVVGVEFSKDMCKCARENILIYKKKTGCDGNMEVVHSDVVDYEFRDDENVFYLFNPFDDVIMNHVIKNIASSIERNPREVFIVYCNPEHANIIEKEKLFVKSTTTMVYGCEFGLYVLSA